MTRFTDLASSAAEGMTEPLSVIQHQVNLLMSQIPEDAPPSVQQSLGVLKDSVEHLAQTVDRISHIQANPSGKKKDS